MGIHLKQVEQPHVPRACKGNSLEDEDQSGQQILSISYVPDTVENSFEKEKKNINAHGSVLLELTVY